MIFHKKTLKILFIICLTSQILIGQREYNFHADASAIMGTSQTPFWMRANQYGAVPTKGQTMALFVGSNSEYQDNKKAIQWGYGLNFGGFMGIQNKFIIQEAYAKAKWKVFEAYAGRRKEIQGLVDTTLSSGSYIWSGNALPIPKIQISIPEYTSIGPSGIFSIKGNYAHGWFEGTRTDASNAYLHQKSFYARIGKPNYKFKLYAGFNHQAQWGGISKFESLGTDTISVGQKFGSSIKDYINVITAKSQVEKASTTLSNDKGNRLGNHLGTFDIGIELNFKPINIFIYRQSIFEDGSLFYLNNITDGLNGISVKFNKNNGSKIKVNKIVFEFLNTVSQGGPFFDDPKLPNIRGNDNYMNNGIFRDGWSYRGTGIGTPFILGYSENLTKRNKLDNLFFNINKVEAYYLGFVGSINKDIGFVGKISFSKNNGTSNFPFHLNQTSFIINLDKDFYTQIGKINIFSNFSGDFGDLLGSNIGVQIGIKKAWFGYNIQDILKFNGHPTHLH